ncbi:hypothetical protein PWT90_07914 [Aphanocladium album]|nr:hypothetical protein PWT90_07914 [Aphanocladium album]
MIFSTSTAVLSLIAVSLAAPANCSNTNSDLIYRTPRIEPFVTVNIRTNYPANVTLHGSTVGVAPILGGQVQGKFNGQLHPNISAETERLMPGSDGRNTLADSQWILENGDKEKIFVSLKGITTYANNALHGFGTAIMETDNEKYDWVNWAHFIVEWQSAFATGQAEFQISQVTTGGRRDGKPIPALEPPTGGN